MHNSDTHLNFIREKVIDMKVALFKSELNSELSLSNNVIQTMSADEEGNVYFFTHCNCNYADQIDRPFYAYLDYHKKNSDVRMCISGKAVIVPDADDRKCEAGLVMIKLKIMQAEYFDREPQISFTQKLKSTLVHLFQPAHQQFNFS